MERLKRNLSVKTLRARTISRDLDHIPPPSDQDEQVRDEILTAASEGTLSEVKSLLKKGHDVNVQDSNGWTPLHCASMSGKFNICKHLLSQPNVSVNKVTNENASPFHYLVRHKDLSPQDEKLLMVVLEMLLKKGCHLDHANRHKETPLHSACMRGNQVAVRFLISNGAQLDLVTNMGETALHYAVRTDAVIVSLLLEHGANPLIKSSAGTPKEVAVEYNRMDIVEALTQYTQKFQKQKRSISTTSVPNFKKESLLSDLIDTSHHTPGHNMLGRSPRDRSFREDSSREREEKDSSSSSSSREEGGGGGRVSFSKRASRAATTARLSAHNPHTAQTSLARAAKHHSTHSTTSLITIPSNSDDMWDHQGAPSVDLPEKKKEKKSKSVSRIQSLKTIRKESFRSAEETHPPSSLRISNTEPVERDETKERPENNDRRVNFGNGPEEEEKSHGKMINKMIAKSVPNIRGAFDIQHSNPQQQQQQQQPPPPSLGNPGSVVGFSTPTLPSPSSPLASSSSPSPSLSPSSPLVSNSSSSSSSSSFARTASQVSQLIPLYKDGALKKGYMNMLRARKWQRLWFVLKERNLIYYSSPNSLEEIGEFDLTNAKITTQSVLRDKPNSFEISIKGRTTILCPDDGREKIEWIEILNRVSDTYSDGSPAVNESGCRSSWDSPVTMRSSILRNEILYPKTPQDRAKREQLAQTQNNLSQLIYALQNTSKDSVEEKLSRLLLDSSYSAVLGLYSIATMENDEDEFTKALIYFFDSFDSIQKLMQRFISLEIETSTRNTIFRDMSMAAKLVSTYCFHVGREYLQEVALPVITTIASHTDPLEVNPNRRTDDADVNDSIDILLSVAQTLLDSIFATRQRMPVGIRQILAHIQVETARVHPEMGDIAMGAFVFLRYFCPALVSPVTYGIMEENLLTQDHQRALIVISKLLQNLANHVEFDGSKEAYMTRFNDSIVKNLPELKKYLLNLVNQEEIFKELRLISNRKEDKKEERSSSLLRILKYLNSKQALITELMAVKL